MFQRFTGAARVDQVAGAVIEEASIAAGRQWLVLVVAIVPWRGSAGGTSMAMRDTKRPWL
jgi:hypothetical protein